MKFGFTFFLLLFFASCATQQYDKTINVAKTYDKNSIALTSDFNVQHVSNIQSVLSIRIPVKSLVFVISNGKNEAQINLMYQLLDPQNLNAPSDTVFRTLTIDASYQKEEWFTYKIPLSLMDSKNYILDIQLKDFTKNEVFKQYVFANKSNINSKGYFEVSEPETGNEKFGQFLSVNQKMKVKYLGNSINKIYVRCYFRDFPLPAPPFSSNITKAFQYAADSIYSIDIQQNEFEISFPKIGFYHFQVDSTISKDGLTFHVFNEKFPFVKKVDQMYLPLRYITDNREFDELSKAEKKKPVIDKFWISHAGNQQRARELISEYYNRVQDANLYFSSYVEGWKSDRGILYIVFGKPSVVRRGPLSETWVYGQEGNVNSLVITFFKVNNPFTDNDYLMDRSEIYKTAWYRAVDLWRQGRVY